MAVALVAFSASTTLAPALVTLAVVGAMNTAFMAVNNAALQLASAPAMRGRVMSVGMMSFGLMPLGALPAGAAADAYGAPLAVGVSAVLLIVVTLAVIGRYPRLLAR